MTGMRSKGFGGSVVVFVAVLLLVAGGMMVVMRPMSAPPPVTSSPTTGPTTSTSMSGPNSTAPSVVDDAGPGSLNSFQTFAELHQFITANAKSVQQQSQGVSSFGGGVTTTIAGSMTSVAATTTVAASGTAAFSSSASTTEEGSPSYTTSNVQVQGVDELDRVKTDGTYMYVATSGFVSIIKAYPASSASLISKIALPNTDILGMTLANQHLLIVGQSTTNSSVELRLYNVSVPSSPTLISSLAAMGSFVGARLTQGYAYIVVEQPSFVVNGNGNVTATYPTVLADGVSSVVSPGSTYYTPNRSQIDDYTMVMSMSMTTGAEQSTAVLTGPSSTIYVSPSNIYVVYSNFYPQYADGIAGDYFGGGGRTITRSMGGGVGQPQQQNSTVFRVAYSQGEIAAKAAGYFSGGVLNQFSMDEYNGYFRVATSRSDYINGSLTRSDDVYVLDQNLTQVGVIKNIAPGENIYSVRFEGDKGYVVTFQQIDPLFTISFADPTDPVIQSALQVSGFSDYLHPFGTDYLIGVGKDAMPAPNGNFAWYLGLKLSLFHVDNSTGNSTEVARYMIGDRGTNSQVLSDHLAFTFDTTTNTMVIPVDLYAVSTSNGNNVPYPGGSPPPFGQFVWQGVYVFNVSTSGFALLGTVSQDLPGQSPGTHEIDRSVIIGGVLYTISQNEVMASGLSSFSPVATIQLP